MTCDYLRRVLALSTLLCAASAASARRATRFHDKVTFLLKEEPENPKCFFETKTSFTCFWEEDEEKTKDLFTFTYNYQRQNSSRCPLRVVPAAGGKKLFVCQLNRTEMFVQMFVRVHREGKLIYNRSLLVDQLFLLDPPANVTASPEKRGQLRVRWLPPLMKYIDDSTIHEVAYAEEGSGVRQVEVAHGSSELILRGLQPGTKYKVQVRANMDGVTYSGYWSDWSDAVLTETLPADLDPLIVSLTFISSFILIVLSLTLFLSHRKFLKKKIWPTIPTPDGKFHGLFTVHGGDFKEWLQQTSGGLWLTPAFSYSADSPSPLLVLSELSLCPSPPSPPLPPKVSRALTADEKVDTVKKDLDERQPLERGDSGLADLWRTTPHDPWLMDHLRALHHLPCSHSPPLESQDAYVALSPNDHGGHKHPEDPLEEALPLEVLFASKTTVLSESQSDLGSVQQNSGSGRLSSQSSFEYPNHTWIPKVPGYTYMAVADSGVSMDYSPMSRGDDIGKVVIYANDYKNEIPAVRRPFLSRQHSVHDEG